MKDKKLKKRYFDDFVKKAQIWHFSLIAIFLTNLIVSAFSLVFHGQVTRDYIITGTVASLIVSYLLVKVLYVYKSKLQNEMMERIKADEGRKKLIEDLRKAIDTIKLLRGFIPICASCKKIRDDKGFWIQVEQYISERSEVEFTHSICPSCMEKLYPDLKK